MSNASQSIVTLYEIEGLSPEQIAEAEGWDITAVKSTLMQFSRVYREKMGTGEEDGFTDEEERACRRVISNIAQWGEDEHLKLRAAMYIRNDKKGRLDIVQNQRGININVTMINEGIAKAMQISNQSRNRIIELEPNEKKLLEAANAKLI